MWTDSRYHIQAEQQLDPTLWTLMKSGLADVPQPVDWLPPNSRVGIDPYLIDAQSFQTLSATLKRTGSVLLEVHPNLVDAVWTDKPQQQLPPVEAWALEFSGRRVADKVAELRTVIAARSATAAVVSALDDVACEYDGRFIESDNSSLIFLAALPSTGLLNLRGHDIENNAVFYAYALITNTTIELYVLNPQRITDDIRAHLQREGVIVEVQNYAEITVGLRRVLTGSPAARVLLSKPNQALFATVPAEQQVLVDSPVNRMKVVKNDIEAAGLRRAHIRDGAAVIKYLHWLDENVDRLVVTELSGAARLAEFRA